MTWRVRRGHPSGCPCETCVGINAVILQEPDVDTDPEETWFGYLEPKGMPHE